MPTVTTQLVDGFAWCDRVDADRGLCPGNEQHPVQVKHTTTAWTFVDSGGDFGGIEKSFDSYEIADESERACGHCGQPLACGTQERPVYMNLSRVSQDGLVDLIKAGKVAAAVEQLVPAGESERIAVLERELASMRELLEKANRPARRAAAAPPDEAA